MSRHNISAIVPVLILLYVIIIFAVYFNNPDLDKVWSIQQKDKDMIKLGAHSPEFIFEKNFTNAGQRLNYPSMAAPMVENHTINTTTTTATIKINNTGLHQINESQFKKAPEFTQISGYINTPNNNNPLTLSSLKGEVVLVYIWTYTCINSIRPLPYIHDWDQKYSDKGLVIVGVHSPEFTFEKNFTNVKNAVQSFGITYPVLLDSDHGTWDAYGNMYWPRFYLIDTHGYIRYDHIGEGSYDQTEKAIRSLLVERAAMMGAKEISFNTNPTTIIKPRSLQYVNLSQNTTPEIYVGYNTTRAPLGNPEGFSPGHTVSYSIHSNTNFKPDVIYLQGNWKNNPDNMELQNDTGRILLTYYAKAVNIIAGGKGGGVVYSDVGTGAGAVGVAASDANANTQNKSSLGVDVSQDGSFKIDGQRLYNLSIHNNYAVHNIVIDIKGKGFQFYTLTFG